MLEAEDVDLASTVWQLSCSLLGLPDDEDLSAQG